MDYIKIRGLTPNLINFVFYVRQDTWDHYCDFHYNNFSGGTCFLPALDEENGDPVFIDITKFMCFYVLEKKEPKTSKISSKINSKPKADSNPKFKNKSSKK